MLREKNGMIESIHYRFTWVRKPVIYEERRLGCELGATGIYVILRGFCNNLTDPTECWHWHD